MSRATFTTTKIPTTKRREWNASFTSAFAICSCDDCIVCSWVPLEQSLGNGDHVTRLEQQIGLEPTLVEDIAELDFEHFGLVLGLAIEFGAIGRCKVVYAARVQDGIEHRHALPMRNRFLRAHRAGHTHARQVFV